MESTKSLLAKEEDWRCSDQLLPSLIFYSARSIPFSRAHNSILACILGGFSNVDTFARFKRRGIYFFFAASCTAVASQPFCLITFCKGRALRPNALGWCVMISQSLLQALRFGMQFLYLVSSLDCVRGLDLFLCKGFRTLCGFWLVSSLGGHGTAYGWCLFCCRRWVSKFRARWILSKYVSGNR